MMDRRAFLRRLGFGTVAAAAAASGVLDIERLLWVPGERTIFIPPPVEPLSQTLNVGDVFTISGYYVTSPITQERIPQLQQFVITKKAESGGLLTVERIVPSVITNGSYRNDAGPKRRPYGINGRDVKPFWARG